MNAEQAYELQVSNLTRSVGNLEEAMRQTEEDKQNLLEDLTAVRELCAKLEATKESIQRQFTSTSLDKEQVRVLWIELSPLNIITLDLCWIYIYIICIMNLVMVY